MDRQYVITLKTIFLTLIIFACVYVLYKLGPVIGVLVSATLIVIALKPLVDSLSKITLFNKPMPHTVAVVVAYLTLISVIILVITVGIPPVISQFQKMLVSLTYILKQFNLTEYSNLSVSDFLPQAAKLPGEFLSLTVSVFSNVTSLISLLVISLYMSMDWKGIKRKILDLFPDKTANMIDTTFTEIENTVGNWVKGELLLMTVVGTACFVGLLVLNVKYALALGIISGILEIVPMLGPTISAILAAIIAFADSPIKGLGVIALYIIVQQLENNLLVPKIMQKVSGFSPLVILLALLVGSKFFGIAGALMAVPMTMILAIILKRVLRGQGL